MILGFADLTFPVPRVTVTQELIETRRTKRVVSVAWDVTDEREPVKALVYRVTIALTAKRPPEVLTVQQSGQIVRDALVSKCRCRGCVLCLVRERVQDLERG